MRTIPLTQGRFAVVDNADYAELMKFKWYANRLRGNFYVVRAARINGKWGKVLMHRYLLGLKLGDQRYTDHINGNSLDNRRSNLRICTNVENCQNRGKPLNNRSGFKGVSWAKRDEKWRAVIRYKSQLKHLGYFDSPLVAALAYNQAAIEHFGEFARLNEIEGSGDV